MTDTTLPPIVQTGALVLRNRAVEVAPEAISSPEMKSLVQVMIATMRAAPGVGLAAPQIGVPLRVIVVEDPAEYQARIHERERNERGRVPFPLRVLFNPVLRHVGDARATFFEGCLSVSGYSALVERSLSVEVEGLDEHGEHQVIAVSGWPARIFQHECDHLDGTLYIDRMLTRSFCAAENLATYGGGKSIAEVRKLLGI
jgi:peptide deformylase